MYIVRIYTSSYEYRIATLHNLQTSGSLTIGRFYFYVFDLSVVKNSIFDPKNSQRLRDFGCKEI